MRFINYVWCVLALCFGACVNETTEEELLSEPFQFAEEANTRATDNSFEEGDLVGIYAVKRNGEAIGTIRPTGNFADNKKYIFRNGQFAPVSTADLIYSPVGQKLDFYVYYPYQDAPSPTSLVINSHINQRIGSNYKESDYLLARSQRGYSNPQTPIMLQFDHVMGLVEIFVQKNGVESISAAKVATVVTQQRVNLQTGNLNLVGSTLQSIEMLLHEETATQYVFRALVPTGNTFAQGEEAVLFTMGGGVVKRFTPASDFPVESGKTTRFDLGIANVVTYGSWNVSVSASLTTIATGGGSSTILATAVRDVFTNGVKTDTERATPTLSASGTGFSLSGTTLTAGANTGAVRSCTVTASHQGVNQTCIVTQDAAAVTWLYHLTVTPTYLVFASEGETKSFTISSTKIKVINGVSTGVAEHAAYTHSITGPDAAAFSVSGTSVVAKENLITETRDGRLTITQTGVGGKSATITLEQKRKVGVDTDI